MNTNRPYKGKMSRQSNGNGTYTHSDKATHTRWALHCNYDEETGEKLGWMFEKIHDGATREGSEDYHATLAEALDALDHYLTTRYYDEQWGWVCSEEAETADQIKMPGVVKEPEIKYSENDRAFLDAAKHQKLRYVDRLNKPSYFFDDTRKYNKRIGDKMQKFIVRVEYSPILWTYGLNAEGLKLWEKLNGSTEKYEPGIGATKPGHEDETDEEIVAREEEEQAIENARKALWQKEPEYVAAKAGVFANKTLTLSDDKTYPGIVIRIDNDRVATVKWYKWGFMSTDTFTTPMTFEAIKKVEVADIIVTRLFKKLPPEFKGD